MRITQILTLLAAGALLGCDATPPRTYKAVAYVRSLWCDRGTCSVVLEGEDGSIFTVKCNEVPPVWVGLHAEVAYQESEAPNGGVYKNFKVLRRLP